MPSINAQSLPQRKRLFSNQRAPPFDLVCIAEKLSPRQSL
jgi:hypothetical protein